MTPAAFIARLKALGLTHEAFAPMIGKTARQVSRYSTGKTPVPKSVQMLLRGEPLTSQQGDE